MKPIGKNFAAELKAAGLLGLPFSWADTGEISFSEEMPPEQCDAVMAVYQAHDPAVQPMVTPEQVTMRQARLALLESGKLAAVNAAVAGMPGAQGDAARIEWEFSSTVERHRPLVAALGVALGLADADLDALFRRAAEL